MSDGVPERLLPAEWKNGLTGGAAETNSEPPQTEQNRTCAGDMAPQRVHRFCPIFQPPVHRFSQKILSKSILNIAQIYIRFNPATKR